MPRGDNPNSRANLVVPSSKQARINGAKGGKATAEMHKKLRTFKELDDEYTTDAERKKMLDALKKRAEQGNLKAIELYRDTMGMKPIEKINVAQIDPSTVDEMSEALKKRRENATQEG